MAVAFKIEDVRVVYDSAEGDTLFPDSHVATITQEYYDDTHFCRQDDGSINLWNFYNLLTSAGKRGYIDSFPERNVNAGQFVMHLMSG